MNLTEKSKPTGGIKFLRAMLAALCVALLSTQALAEEPNNYAARQAHIINNSPLVELSGFKFSNEYRERAFRLVTDLSWKNVGEVPITAFEVVVAYFDPFNRPISSGGGRWLVPGNNSGNWSPLEPGQSNADGLIGRRAQDAFTGFVYVRAVRLQDGTVWMFDENEIRAAIKEKLPEVRSFENVSPPLESEE